MTFEHFPWLTTLVIFPLLASFVIPLIPEEKPAWIRNYTLGVSLSELGLILYTFSQFYDLRASGLQLVDNFEWAPQIGLTWSLDRKSRRRM
ncbi:MAG: NAD(P)H-quinone oxidoreductase subunit 4, partial [Leptolyngbya sp. SIO4C1]|nr:NAD(P)H-quinone oxidoreductase subunit 4 [Leptolyngbya sp. SIO4C1]